MPAAPPLMLRPGDVLLLLTDGVVEAESATASALASAGPWKRSRPAATSPPQQMIAALRRELDEFCANQPIQDDVTIVIVKCLET